MRTPLLTAFVLAACAPHDAPATEPAAEPTDELVASEPIAVVSAPRSRPPVDPTLVVHEWGTFTAVAGDDGVALDWRPLAGPSDLPRFVYDVNKPGLRDLGARGKGDMTARIRMETPVIYFYAAHELDVRVAVDFTDGEITEWYPKAKSFGSHGIDWGTIRVLPDADVVLPHDGSESHYYPARVADADTVRSCDAGGVEHEGFLFYRGVGQANLELEVTLQGDRLALHDRGTVAIPEAIVFENEAGKIGVETIDPRRTHTRRPVLDDDLDAAIALVESRLVDSGLRAAEAAAMIETWKGDWFEPGLRVIYLLPRPQTDAMLPLTLEPPPDELVRTMVGRIEVVTPELEAEIRALLLQIDRRGAEAATLARLAEQSRFAEPVLARLLAHTTDAAERARITAVLESGRAPSISR